MATETQAQIDRINTEVATQADKIAQLSTILDGKAAGGGASVETCTVTIENDAYEFVECVFSYTTYKNGIVASSIKLANAENEFTLDDVVKGSIMTVTQYGDCATNGRISVVDNIQHMDLNVEDSITDDITFSYRMETLGIISAYQINGDGTIALA